MIAEVQFKDLSIGKGNNFTVTRIHRDLIRALLDALIVINNRLNYDILNEGYVKKKTWDTLSNQLL